MAKGLECHFELIYKNLVKPTLTMLILFIFNHSYSQIEFKINEIKVDRIIEFIDYNGSYIEGTYGIGPRITVFCEINNKTNDTVVLDLATYELYIVFKYLDKNFECILGSKIDDVDLDYYKYIENKKFINILPKNTFSFSFRTPYLLGTDLFKDYTHSVVDYTIEVIETLPTLKVKYKDIKHDITSSEILKVTVENFVFRY